MAATDDLHRARWPRDLKIFAVCAALWAGALTARLVMRDIVYYSATPIDAILFGMRFEAPAARAVLAAQAMCGFSIAIGIAAEKQWGLWLAFAYMAEVVASEFIFMTAYMDNLAVGSEVRAAGLLGISAVLLLLYLWIRARALLMG
ncbi:MAG TPA: hypothetical protein VKR29_02570 [Candidatus Binataceae bacterium]|nr:hypothetical protein [Candidatus Binataceae bacterium]